MDNKTLTINQIIEILESGKFDKFLGVDENECLEAKRKRPYNLIAGRKSLAEFAKDIANIANGESAAFIILGLVTDKSLTAKTDVITGLDLFTEKEMYSEAEVIALVRQGVYPKVEIRRKWYPSKADSTKGLGTLFIGKQPEEKKYFIAKVVESGDEKLSGYFGIPVRKGSETIWLPFDQIYAASKKTPTKPQEMFIEISGQLEEIKNRLHGGGASGNDSGEELDQKIKEVLDEQ
jgi:hypothetical protein